jgi:hypothetical protein
MRKMKPILRVFWIASVFYSQTAFAQLECWERLARLALSRAELEAKVSAFDLMAASLQDYGTLNWNGETALLAEFAQLTQLPWTLAPDQPYPEDLETAVLENKSDADPVVMLRALRKLSALALSQGLRVEEQSTASKSKQKKPSEQLPTTKPQGTMNVDLETLGDPEGAKIVARVNSEEVLFFRTHTWELVDGIRGLAWSAGIPDAPTIALNATDKQLELELPVDSLPLPEPFVIDTNSYREGPPPLSLRLYRATRGIAPLSADEQRVYLSPTGARLSDWPKHLQLAYALIHQEWKLQSEDTDRDLESAREMAAYIRQAFTYFTKKTKVKTVPELAAKGSLRYDSAAIVLVSLLREMGIPCRIKFGYPAMSSDSQPGFSFALDRFMHGLVEVPGSDGEWHEVDPTPIVWDDKKVLKRFQNFAFQMRGTYSPPGMKSTKGGGSTPLPLPGNGKGKAQPDKISLDSNGEKRGERDPFQKNELTAARREEVALEALRKRFERDGDSELPTNPELPVQARRSTAKNDLNPNETTLSADYAADITRRLAAWALSPKISSKLREARVLWLRSVSKSPMLMPVYSQFSAMLETIAQQMENVPSDAPPLVERLKRSVDLGRERGIGSAVDEWREMHDYLNFLRPLLREDENKALETVRQTLARLLDVVAQLKTVKKGDAILVRLAHELFEHLPGQISRQALSEKFRIQTLGNNAPTKALGAAIAAGELNAFRLSAVLGPHTKFIVEPEVIYSGGKALTWLPAQKQKGPLQLMLTDDPRTSSDQLIRLAPHLPDDVAFRGYAMAKLGRRQRTETTMGYVAARERATMVFLYDTSGSMNGSTAYFVSVYMQSFIDRFLSEGPEHEARLLGFDATVHTDIRLSTPEQGKDFVMHSQRYTRNTQGSTEAIAEAIDVALSKLREDDRRATLVLVSDCISEIDIESIEKKLRMAKQPVRFALLSVNQGSAKLAQLALNADHNPDGMRFVHWSTDQIRQLVQATNSANPLPKSAFWSDVPWLVFASKNAELLNQLQNATRELEMALPALWSGGHRSTEQMLRAFRASRLQSAQPKDEQNRDFMLRHIVDLLRLTGSKNFEGTERWFILDPFFANWKTRFRDVENLNAPEREQLRRIVEWMEDGDG